MKAYRVKVYVGPAWVEQIANRIGGESGTSHVYLSVYAESEQEAKDWTSTVFQSNGVTKPLARDMAVVA